MLQARNTFRDRASGRRSVRRSQRDLRLCTRPIGATWPSGTNDTGVYRIAHFPVDRLARYGEAVLWAQANHHGLERIALSHETAMLVYGISDLNPSKVHLTVPKSARFRRERPDWIAIHQADLTDKEVGEHEGIPVTTVTRSILDVLPTTHRTDVVQEAIKRALREGLLNSFQATGLRKIARTGEDWFSTPTN